MPAQLETPEYQTLRDALNDPAFRSVRVIGIAGTVGCTDYINAARKLGREGFAMMEFTGNDLVVERRDYESKAIDRDPISAEVMQALGAVRLR